MNRMKNQTVPMIVAIMENIFALLEFSRAIAALPIRHAGSTLVALMMAAIPSGQNRKIETTDQAR
jgi:hypothetical protein